VQESEVPVLPVPAHLDSSGACFAGWVKADDLVECMGMSEETEAEAWTGSTAASFRPFDKQAEEPGTLYRWAALATQRVWGVRFVRVGLLER